MDSNLYKQLANRFPIEPTLLPLLHAMYDEARGENDKALGRVRIPRLARPPLSEASTRVQLSKYVQPTA